METKWVFNRASKDGHLNGSVVRIAKHKKNNKQLILDENIYSLSNGRIVQLPPCQTDEKTSQYAVIKIRTRPIMRIFLRAILTHLLVDIFITNQLVAYNNPYRRPKRPLRFFLRIEKSASTSYQTLAMSGLGGHKWSK